MIRIICPSPRISAGRVVFSALKRICTDEIVDLVSLASLKNWLMYPTPACWVFIDPPEAWSDLIIKALETPNTKILLLGSLPPTLANRLDAKTGLLTEDIREGAKCAPATIHSFSESALRVDYIGAISGVESPLPTRPFLRYDFMDEWNNLGYGAILTDDSIWSIRQIVQLPPSVAIALIFLDNLPVSAYVGLWDEPSGSLFWVNRSVGLVDSAEFCLIETFLSSHRHDRLPCWPIIGEIPYGYDAAVTMRLDCDEDVESARELWTLYRNLDVPFSIAIHTSLLSEKKNHVLPQEILTFGGAILSHSATHAPNWGGGYENALAECTVSRSVINDLTGKIVRYAVSPFHQNPIYALEALADAGYDGCIGGIIRNDPDFLIFRSGAPIGISHGFVGHSQQCMLHGDCLLDTGDPLSIFRQAFDISRSGRSFFGYLDHPFSSRYRYGWKDELFRSAMHAEFIAYIRSAGKVLFCNEDDAMDFLAQKVAIRIIPIENGYRVEPSSNYPLSWPVALAYKGEIHPLKKVGINL